MIDYSDLLFKDIKIEPELCRIKGRRKKYYGLQIMNEGLVFVIDKTEARGYGEIWEY